MSRSRSRNRPRLLALPDPALRIAIAGERLRPLVAAFDLVLPERADVALIDVADAAALDETLAEGFSLPTILLVDDPHADTARAAFRAGAAGVIARESDAREVTAAIEAVAAGLLVFDPAAREVLRAAPPIAGAAVDPLTDRERSVLAMLARGLSNKRIAERLAISEHTVKFHVGSILGKLGAATRAEAVALGARRGLVML